MEKEIWRAVVGYEGLYEVSNLGRVRSLERVVARSYHSSILCKSKIMKQRLDAHGYYKISLSDEKHNHKSFFVHRIVASAFIPNPNNYPIINHKDQNPKNNYVCNLEWCTQKYNCNWADRNERLAAHFEKPIKQIKNEVVVKIWKSGSQIERETGYKRRNIQKACNGEYGYKSPYGYKWEWA